MAQAASVVTYTVEAANAGELHENVWLHLIPAAREVNGYEGFLLLDQGDGKRMAILLFDSVDGVRAAQQVLTPVGEQHTYALMSGPAIGSLGTVVMSDGLFAGNE